MKRPKKFIFYSHVFCSAKVNISTVLSIKFFHSKVHNNVEFMQQQQKKSNAKLMFMKNLM